MFEKLCSQVVGPLAPYAAGFTQRLESERYEPTSVRAHLHLMADLSRWLESQRIGAKRPGPRRIEAFVATRRKAGTKALSTPRSLRLLCCYLATLGVEEEPDPLIPIDRFLTDYRCYLIGERSLGELTVKGYVATARHFMDRVCQGELAELERLSAKDVYDFVRSEGARGLSPRTVNEQVVRIRALLRYLYNRGVITARLDQATPWMAHSRDTSPPKTLGADVVDRLLDSCDRATLVGLRDFAILKLIARLGLRAGEVIALELQHLDWVAGEITITGKGGYMDRLPIPQDVGSAIAEYLTCRGPYPGARNVFLALSKQGGAMKRTAVRAIADRACERAGIFKTGTHRLRHGLAAELLRRGSSLPEIGQLLRHHHLSTTAKYAKVDFSALESVASPWPKVAS